MNSKTIKKLSSGEFWLYDICTMFVRKFATMQFLSVFKYCQRIDAVLLKLNFTFAESQKRTPGTLALEKMVTGEFI